MKTNSPTHEEVTQRAEEIWKARGCPDGCDTDIWLEAERQLSGAASIPSSSSDSHGQNNGGTAAKVANQKKEARAPKLPAKSAPKPMPAEMGKPLWDKPHSS